MSAVATPFTPLTGATTSFERAFLTSFVIVRRKGGAGLQLRAKDYTIPGALATDIKTIFGMHGLPLPERRPIVSETTPATVAQVTPTTIRSVYGVSGVVPSGSVKNRQAVAEFQGQTFSNGDLTEFFKSYVPFSKNATDAQIYQVVGTQTGASGIEAALDVEYIMGVAPGILTEFWGFQGQDFCTDLKDFTAKILSSKDPPNVFSISYGIQDNLRLPKYGCDPSDIEDIDSAWASMAARGISIIVSSGDSGSGCINQTPFGCTALPKGEIFTGPSTKLPMSGISKSADFCCDAAKNQGYAGFSYVKEGLFKRECYGFQNVSATGTNPKAVSGMPAEDYSLFASWPASSPWVTAVGSTRFIGQDPSGKSGEMATDQFGSGGGFSAHYNRSSHTKWQEADVSAYQQAVSAKLPPSGTWKPSGRGTPDVSALGEGYQVIANGKTETVGGTSASAPAFAAIISLLNEARLAKGKPQLGFLNPFIYKNKDAFHDVVVGTDKIDRLGYSTKYGFDATKGWDPVTGHGTPQFQKLLAAALAQ